MTDAEPRPRLVLVGGTGGLVGRHLLEEFRRDWDIVSVHRSPAPGDGAPHVTFVPTDASVLADWRPLLRHADLVINVAWYRAGSLRRFRPLTDGLLRMIRAASDEGIPRLVHISVPDSPPTMEATLPYMRCKREVDRAVESGSVPYSIVRPTMLFAERDKLVTVMMRTMERYHRFPMFESGDYHVSPLAARDLARIVRRESGLGGRRNVAAGGPRRWRYVDLTDAMFQVLARTPRYVHLSARSGLRLARLLEAVGSTLLYAYEVEWLVSDMLGLPPYEGLSEPLRPVDGFLVEEAARLTGSRSAARG